jgi:quinol monooxygenase YgiN
MELAICARFRARPGSEAAVQDALLECIGPTRAEPGCLSGQVFRSIRDPLLFYVHSRWLDEVAFEKHAGLPYTLRMLERRAADRPPARRHPVEGNRVDPSRRLVEAGSEEHGQGLQTAQVDELRLAAAGRALKFS